MAQLYEVKDLHDDCLKYYAKLSKEVNGMN